MNGTAVKQTKMFSPEAENSSKAALMERRLAEKCVTEIALLGETGVTITQVERFLRALAVLHT